jgi:hypothetical protein
MDFIEKLKRENNNGQFDQTLLDNLKTRDPSSLDIND